MRNVSKNAGGISSRLTLPKLQYSQIQTHRKLMSFGTGTLKVSGEGHEEYKHHREASMATRQIIKLNVNKFILWH